MQANKTLHHLMTDCEAITTLQLDIMKNKIPLPHMTWLVFETQLSYTLMQVGAKLLQLKL